MAARVRSNTDTTELPGLLVLVVGTIAQEPPLGELLAGEAVDGPRDGLQPLLLDLLPALFAGAIGLFLDGLEGAIHEQQLLPLEIRQRVEELLRVGADGVVDVVLVLFLGVLGGPAPDFLHVMDELDSLL